ncbi:MAG: hypothetical protein HOM84_00165 [Thiotrichales bacterium]|jgi:hypothetical protein|nr:hypothetical protein [Thiotrichales bacterium]MBT3613653.1 hypothetical protein [Thiotrichales bacterium]MBT3753168.1 hypothetical protein [Thiotrichales bacterium]MBT3837486.1 hypothetical protein [Thiotrichales bacterium]MBT4151898.1 hypothetical protein [Thiotrichales bacterium]
MKTPTNLLKTISAIALTAAALSPLNSIAAYKVVDVTNGGTITGTVTLKKAAPKSAHKVYDIKKDNSVCGSDQRIIDYVKTNGKALLNTIVYLTKVKSGKAWGETPADITLDQKGCEFTPFLSIMQNGGKLTAINSDPVLHNLHTYELFTGSIKGPKKTVANVSQPDQGSKVTKTVKLKKGFAMKVECDAHDFMHGFVFVAKSPYYAVVDADGKYTIDNIPAGKYKVKAFNGFLKPGKGKATIKGGDTVTVDIQMK